MFFNLFLTRAHFFHWKNHEAHHQQKVWKNETLQPILTVWSRSHLCVGKFLTEAMQTPPPSLSDSCTPDQCSFFLSGKRLYIFHGDYPYIYIYLYIYIIYIYSIWRLSGRRSQIKYMSLRVRETKEIPLSSHIWVASTTFRQL